MGLRFAAVPLLALLLLAAGGPLWASAQTAIPASKVKTGLTASDLQAALDTGEIGQHRTSSNCPGENGGAPRELCRQDQTLWMCTVSAPSVCNAASWVQVGGSVGDGCVQLDAGEITCSGSAGCTGELLHGTGQSYLTATFSASTDQSGSWQFEVPVGFTGHTVTVQLDWTSDHTDCNNAAADDVCMVFDSGSVANDGAWNAPTLGGTANGLNDTCIANGDLMRQTRTGYIHGMSDGQRGVFMLTRDVLGTPTGCASEDDYTQKLKLLSVSLCPE